MKLKEKTYRGYLITVHMNETTDYFYATSNIASSHKEFNKELKNFGGGYETVKEAIKDVENKIDVFYKSSPKTYIELANAITESLVWTGYEDCYVDSKNLEILVEAFIKTKNS